MRFLWLAGDYPFQAYSGLLAYSSGLLQATADAGASITALCLRPTGAVSAAKASASVEWRFVEGVRRRPIGSLLSPLPQLAHVLANPRFRARLAEALGDPGWDAVVVDHLQMGWAAGAIAGDQGAGAPPPIVYASQNHEESTRRDIARHHVSYGPRKVVLGLDAYKAARLERSVVDRSALISVVTDDDRRRFAARNPDKSYVVLSPGYDGPRVPERRITENVPRRAVIVSNLHWHVKRANLEAFLEVADPLFERAAAEIVVVGPGPEAYFDRLRAGLRATTFTGWVESLSDVLAASRIGVVSEPAGGGFKLKSLDYVFHRLPVAVLAGSASGLPLATGEEMLAFPNEEALARGVLAAIDDLPRLNVLQEHAYQRCSAGFDWSARGRALVEAVTALR